MFIALYTFASLLCSRSKASRGRSCLRCFALRDAVAVASIRCQLCLTITASARVVARRETAHARLAAAIIVRVFFSSGMPAMSERSIMYVSASCCYSDFKTHAAPAHAVWEACRRVYTLGQGKNIMCCVYDTNIFSQLIAFSGINTWVEFVPKDRRPESGGNLIATIHSNGADDESIAATDAIMFKTVYDKLTNIRRVGGASGNVHRGGHPDADEVERMIGQMTPLSVFASLMMRAMLSVHPCAAAAYFRESGIATALQPFGCMNKFQRSGDRGVDVGALPCEGALDPNGGGRFKVMSCGRHVASSATMRETFCPLCDSRRWYNVKLNNLCGVNVETSPAARKSVLITTDDSCLERSLSLALTPVSNVECRVARLSTMDSICDTRFDIIAFVGNDHAGIYKTLSRVMKCIDIGVEIVSIETPRAGRL